MSKSECYTRRFPTTILAQHSEATLLRHCFERLQHDSNIATQCWAENRRCESSRVVALQLCPPLQFGPLTYQPIEWGFVSSNQSAL